MSAPAEPIQYRRGMTYGEFLEMMAQRRDAVPAPMPVVEPADECEHPFADVRKVIRAKRVPTATGTDQIRIIVEYECAGCDQWLGHDRKGFRL